MSNANVSQSPNEVGRRFSSFVDSVCDPAPEGGPPDIIMRADYGVERDYPSPMPGMPSFDGVTLMVLNNALANPDLNIPAARLMIFKLGEREVLGLGYTAEGRGQGLWWYAPDRAIAIDEDDPRLDVFEKARGDFYEQQQLGRVTKVAVTPDTSFVP